jgi:hypothetical protein
VYEGKKMHKIRRKWEKRKRKEKRKEGRKEGRDGRDGRRID